ncbi:DMT family transporter [Dyella caseinilytica]|uniref:QacE family quaternary ammonium compound efflux SMR transporter n=1 Tax=Dyella caseinilytica TaxID=1849581 RepID=A0ABX7GSQ3_9GAMM|nr:SMR family transporter [Dyella caseinilytica]QRN52929.1 QacE family quaternary ammonium compound efflux SMR transporter [Dyella caseinilytica]GGA09940.1 multidrug transporter [Dyella caseinilytica]
MNVWLTLGVAIIAEVIGTSALKASHGFSQLLPSMVVVAGYGVAFFCLSLTLRQMPIGIAYAVWSGAGTALIALIGVVLYKQRLDIPAIIGIVLIISGVLVLNLFSKSSPH